MGLKRVALAAPIVLEFPVEILRHTIIQTQHDVLGIQIINKKNKYGCCEHMITDLMRVLADNSSLSKR